jgi:hypothetical protein
MLSQTFLLCIAMAVTPGVPIGIAFAAGGAAPRTPNAQAATWEMKKFDRHLPGCEQHPAARCASVTLSYPEITNAPPKGKTEINTAIQDMVLTPIEKGTAPKDQEAFAAQILAHYQTWLQRGGDPRSSWTVERKIDVDYSSPRVFSLRLLERVEQAKTRAAKNTVYFNFRPEDGTLIQLSELIGEDQMPKFEEIAEKHFHDKDQKVHTGDDQKRPGQEFALPKNFAIEKDGLRFRYEEDQVDLHSIRTPEFVVPYSEIRSLFRNGVKIP